MPTGPAPYYQDELVRLHLGDCLDILPELPDYSVDAVVTDPPYNLSFMGAQWDSFGGQRNGGIRGGTGDKGILPGYGRGGTNADVVQFKQRGARAFQAWCQQWAAECLRILKPGGHLLAFGGTRTSHRLACAIEDAGFEIRDSIAWLYGSGFPKSHAVGKHIDRMLGATRETKTVPTWYGTAMAAWLVEGGGQANHHQADAYRSREKGSTVEISGDTPATPEAAQWQGWGTALKPAHEPIVVARKPLTGTVAANVLRWGTGALNIDACRIETDWETDPTRRGWQGRKAPDRGMFSDGHNVRAEHSQPNPGGRWPANVTLDESQAAALDRMSGEVGGGGERGESAVKFASIYSAMGPTDAPRSKGDRGGASRFFYTAKASSDERITHNGVSHATVKPLSLMRWLVRLVTPPGGVILEPFAGSGTTVEAAMLEGFRCIAIEREADYLPLITQRINRRRDPIAYLTAAGDDLGLFGEDTA